MTPGERFGRYELLDLLGRGAMGQVFRAHDHVLHRQVALKLLGDETGDTTANASTPATQSVLREARHAAALTHPNVVALYDVGEHEGRLFLVMELVSGRSLRSYVGTNVSVASRLRWLRDVARALSAAHRIGLVHRDIKPENVLVSDEGVAKVLDFGIARRVEPSQPTSAGAAGVELRWPVAQARSLLAGTPGYMAPELLRGQPTDARVDQFAWGVMAYELLSGHSPWGDAEPDAMMHALLHQEPPLLDSATLGIDADVARAVARALRKSPSARFPTMDDLLEALEGPTAEGRHPGRGAPPAQETDGASTAPATYFKAQPPDTSPGAERPRSTRARSRARLVWIAAAAAIALTAVVGGAIALRRPSGASSSGEGTCKPCELGSATLGDCCVQ
jgi:serine/threonine protein kinase